MTDTRNQAEEPIISVLMPVYNSEPFLVEAIESILNQTMGDFEFLIVYDESKDNSYAIIERYRKRDSRIRVVQGQKKALIGALNQGLDAARGRYIARMDADDISCPERFEKQVQLMEAAGADICGCHWLAVNETGKLVDAKIVPLSPDAFTATLACTVPFAHGSVMVRTAFLRKHSLRYGGAKYAEDYDLWIRFWEKGAVFVNVDEFLFKYRNSDTSLSQVVSKGNASDTRALRRRFVRTNSDACLRAVKKLTESYESLSQVERVFLLLAAYLISLILKRPVVFGVARRSAKRSIGMALLYLVRGF